MNHVPIHKDSIGGIISTTQFGYREKFIVHQNVKEVHPSCLASSHLLLSTAGAKKGKKLTVAWGKLQDVYNEPAKRLEQAQQEKAMTFHKLHRVTEENDELRGEKEAA